MNALLAALLMAFVAPPLVLAVGPLLDGVGRRVRARLEARVGPPLAQGYLDLAKLVGKENVVSTAGPLAVLMPYLALAAAVSASLLLPLGGHAPLGFAGDVLVLLYLLGLSSAAFALGGAGSGSAYAFLGASRELVILLLVEPVVACAFLVLALQAGTFQLDGIIAWRQAHGLSVASVLAAAAVIVAMMAYLGRVPFDLAEAEQELTGGSLVEFAGRPLALYRWALFTRWLVAAWLVVEAFAPSPFRGAAGVVVTVIGVLVLFVVLSALSVLFARLRLDEARKVLVQVGLLTLFAIAFAVIGA
ncbi:MAG: respiratory chain complex I subunit 1 family protein [Gemmatimonadaceae bacterium]